MSPATADYAFHKVTRGDLAMLRGWLAEPHVRTWWGDPEEEVALIAGDLDRPEMDLNLVLCDGVPFAYIQSWDVHAYDSGLADQPPGTRGVDPFIGVPAMVGRGHGPRFLAAFAERLFAAGAPRVTIDPDPDNAIAIRAYERAGFRLIDTRTFMDGPVALMARDAPQGHLR